MLGRFLEISVQTPNALESLQFYESLGFQQASVGETWPHPYAVVTDGRLFLGLHQTSISSPTLTFVKADLAVHARDLRALEIEFDYERLSADEFNEVGFSDPLGHRIRVIEARTFSPPSLEVGFASTCGDFVELGLPVRAFGGIREFWEKLGFVALEEETQPFNRIPLTGDLLNIGLHRSRALRYPLLMFEDRDMPERLARLRERGIAIGDEMPDTLDDRENGVLIAPEGTRLLLLRMVDN